MSLAPANWPAPLLRAIRVFNKHVLNPIAGRGAGRKDSVHGIIRHTGRKSGKQYSTPVGIECVPDGFVIPLGYGARVDWLQNVLAAGRGAVVVRGATYDVCEPEVIDAAAALPMLEPRPRRRYERLGIEQYLMLKPDTG